ncbi:MAG: endonuclease/exonuclease/phosphatase family protein [Pseudomonadota bacterium]
MHGAGMALLRLLLSTSISVVVAGLVVLGLAADTLNIWLLSFVYSFRIYIGAVTILIGTLAILIYRRNFVAYALVFVATSSTLYAYIDSRAFSPGLLFGATIDAEPNLRVVSFNVLGDNPHGARIVEILSELDPDIAIILEARALRTELDGLSETYPYRIGCGEVMRRCDSLILSKYDIENREVHDLSVLSPDRLLSGDIIFEGVAIRVASAHLTKPYYDGRQRSEIWEVVRRFLDYQGNLILAGDFNSSFLQPSTRRIPDLLNLQTGPSEPASWPIAAGRWGIAIDHILARPPLQIVQTRQIEDNAGSNHFGLYADIFVPGTVGRGPENVVATAP